MSDNTNPNQNSSSGGGGNPVKFELSAKDTIETHGLRQVRTGHTLHMMARIPDDDGNLPVKAVGRTATIDAVRLGGGPWAQHEPTWEFDTGRGEPLASTHNGEASFTWTSPGGGGQYDKGPYSIKATAGGVTQEIIIETHEDKVQVTKDKVGLELVAPGFKELGNKYASHYKLVMQTEFGFTTTLKEYSELQDKWNSPEVADGYYYDGSVKAGVEDEAHLQLKFGKFYIDKFTGGLEVKPRITVGLSWKFDKLRYSISKDPEAPLPGRWSGSITAKGEVSGKIDTEAEIGMTSFGTECFRTAGGKAEVEVKTSASVTYDFLTQNASIDLQLPELKGKVTLTLGKYDLFGHPKNGKGPLTITTPDLNLGELSEKSEDKPKQKIVLPKHGHDN